MLIHSLSLLFCRSQINPVRSIHIPWLAQNKRHTVPWRKKFIVQLESFAIPTGFNIIMNRKV